jgi:DNA-binding NtrC family response regulator
VSKQRIMFVDDDASILAGLRGVLRRDRERWDMVFAIGGEAALAELEHGAFDVIVSDMRMPGIDGAALLEEVKDRSPTTIRIMLSGSVDQDVITRATYAVDELLGKPCDARTLRATIDRLLNLRSTRLS